MALVLNDRVKETSTTTGQGTLSLAGAATGFETFVTGVGDGNTTYYLAAHESDGTWELGIGTITDASPDTLARTTVIDTSAGNTTKIDFASGSKTIFCTLPASKAVFLDADGDVTLGANLSVGGNLDVTGTFDLSDSNFTNAGDIQLDSITGDGDTDTKITFSGSDVITVRAGGDDQITFTNGAIVPSTDNDIDLGTSSVEFKDAYFDGTVTSDAFAGPLTGNVTGNVSGTAATVTGAAQSNITSLGTLTTLTVDNVIINGTTIGHTDDTDLMTVADGVLTVAGEVSMTTLDIGGTNVTSTAAELNLVDGITAGTVSASLAVIADSNKDISGFRNVTLTGELDAATLDISGNADIDGTTNLDAVDIDGAVQIDAAVTVGVDDTGYDFKLFGATSGSFLLWDESDDALELTDSSPIKIGDGGDMTIYHDGSHSYVTNATGTLKLATETSGIAVTIGHTTSEVTVGDNLTVTGDLTVSGTTTTVNSTTVNLNDHNIVLDTGNSTSAVINGAGITIEGGSGDDATFTYSTTGPKFELKLGSSYEDLQVDQLIAASLDISGDVDVDGTLEADAITVDGTTLAEFISDTAGAMVSSNTETGITVTYQDADNTIDFALAAAQTTITSLLATDIKIGEDDETKIDFETADEIHFYAANVEQVYLGDNIFGPQSDSDVDLGSTSVRWKDAFVDSITVTGEVDGASLDISGNADIDGTLEADAITIDGTAIGSLFATSGDATALAIALG
jgi:cytoskeletal protein CcmA (bactofilin family)